MERGLRPRGRRFRPLCGAWALCVLFVFAQPAALRAEGSASEPGREAALHFDRGVELYGEGNLDAALVEFERAYELVSSHRVLYNLAQVQAERHEYVAALGLFEKYLAEGGSEVPESRRVETTAEIARLRTRVVELWVDTDVEGASLFVNGESAGGLPLAAPVLINPGLAHVRVEKAGYEPASRELRVTGGDRVRLGLPLDEHAAANGSGAKERSDASLRSYKPAWICSAVTLALGGATLSLGLITRDANRALDAELDRFPARESELADRRSKVKTYAALTDGVGAATVVALGLAVYFLIDPPKAAPRGRELAGPGSKRGLARASEGMSLKLLPRTNGLTLMGRF